jgi:hypothetical protein
MAYSVAVAQVDRHKYTPLDLRNHDDVQQGGKRGTADMMDVGMRVNEYE